VRFPNPGDERLRQGASRNFQVFDAMEFLAEVTQHIPNKGQHVIRYFGWYSNKKRRVRKKKKAAAEGKQDIEPEDGNGFLKQRRMNWAALIKKVYEIAPLRCPACGGTMKIVSFIDKCQPEVVEKILRHCGLWEKAESRPPPVKSTVAEPEPYYD